MKYLNTDINRQSSTGALEHWHAACTKAAESHEFFQIFRRSRSFMDVIEGTSLAGGLWNLSRIKNNGNFLATLPLILKSDWYGSPKNLVEFEYLSNDSKNDCALSPTTIRYANNALNILGLFGKRVFSNEIEIHEIGAGYGGECKIFNDFALTLCQNDLSKSWHTYDLKTSYALINKWLDIFSYKTNICTLEDSALKNSNDSLVISNAALSEMHGELLLEYLNKIVLKAKYGYFMTNFESHSKPFGGFSTAQFIDYLKTNGKPDVIELHAGSHLGLFDAQAGTRLVVFGHGTYSPPASPLTIDYYVKLHNSVQNVSDLVRSQ